MWSEIIALFSQVEKSAWVMFAAGLGIPFLLKLLNITIKFTRYFHRLRPYVSTWYVYHWSREDYNPIFRYEEWKIRRAFFKPLHIKTFDPKRKTLSYSGNIKFEGSNVIITLTSVSHREETIQVRIQPDPIPGPNDRGMVMRGIFIDHDFDRRIYCAIFLAVQNEITEDEAKKAIKRLSLLSSKESSLRLKQQSILPENHDSQLDIETLKQ